MRKWEQGVVVADTPGEARRGGRFTLWTARHPFLSALLISLVLTLLAIAKSAFVTAGSGRSLHVSARRLWTEAGLVEAIFFVLLAGLNVAVARSRRRSGKPVTAETLDLPFVEDRDTAARRPPAVLVLRPSLRHPFGLLTTIPLVVGVVSLVTGVVDVGSGHSAVLWLGMAPLWLATGVWTTTGHRRQRVVVDSDDVYGYTFTGRYRRVDRSRVTGLLRTKAEPILVGADGGRLLRLPLGLTPGQIAELAQVLQLAVQERTA